MIPLADADKWLKRLLSEDHDVDTAFPQEVRISALQEAVIAYSRLRPDRYSEHVRMEYDEAEGAYTLPDEYEWILEVKGLESDGVIQALKAETNGGMSNAGQECWMHASDGASNFVWSRADPRHVYTDSVHEPDKNQAIIASAFKIAQAINGLLTDNEGQLNAPISTYPMIIEYALSRCYTIETSSGGMQTQHLGIFRALVDERLNVDMRMNPLASFYYGNSKR